MGKPTVDAAMMRANDPLDSLLHSVEITCGGANDVIAEICATDDSDFSPVVQAALERVAYDLKVIERACLDARRDPMALGSVAATLRDQLHELVL